MDSQDEDSEYEIEIVEDYEPLTLERVRRDLLPIPHVFLDRWVTALRSAHHDIASWKDAIREYFEFVEEIFIETGESPRSAVDGAVVASKRAITEISQLSGILTLLHPPNLASDLMAYLGVFEQEKQTHLARLIAKEIVKEKKLALAETAETASTNPEHSVPPSGTSKQGPELLRGSKEKAGRPERGAWFAAWRRCLQLNKNQVVNISRAERKSGGRSISHDTITRIEAGFKGHDDVDDAYHSILLNLTPEDKRDRYGLEKVPRD